MNIFDAAIQGAVQGITEFLPISSSGHLLISQHILGISENNLFFNVMLHIGTLVAVIAFYYKRIFKLIIAFFEIIKDMIQGKSKKKFNADKNFVIMVIVGLLPLLLMFLPVAPGAVDVKNLAENLSDSNYIIIPGISLLTTGLLLYIGTQKDKKSSKDNTLGKLKNFSGGVSTPKSRINVYDALWIGLSQFFAAIFPGLSRSGSTLSVGMIRGINKQTALDYSFILGIPAVMAAALLELKDAIETGSAYEIGILPIIVGITVSAVVGFLAIKLFKWFLNTEKMWIFILYVTLIGGIITIIGVIECLMGVNLFTGMRI